MINWTFNLYDRQDLKNKQEVLVKYNETSVNFSLLKSTVSIEYIEGSPCLVVSLDPHKPPQIIKL